MGQTVYADLYFMINFSMDFLCFYVTARMMSAKLSVWRAVLAAVLGGIYAVIALLLPVGRFFALLIDIAVCSLMCVCAFLRKRELRSTLLYVPVYIAVSMVLGGVMTALFNIFDSLDIPLPDSDSDGVSVWIFALLAVISGVFTLLGGRFFAKRGARKRAVVRVECGKRGISLNALCDSGNLLREPISNSPCIVVEAQRMRGIIPDEVIAASADGGTDAITSLCIENIKRTRLIPARSAVGEKMLVGYRPDKITVNSGKGERSVCAYIILSELGETADGEDALVPPELI